MDLRDWRKSKDLTLEEAAALFAMPVSTLSDLERGVPDKIYHHTLLRIEAVTTGAVTFADLHRSWRIENPELAISTIASGRAAWRDRTKKSVSRETKSPRPARRSKRKASRQPAAKRR